jgi:hypothetical protein
MGTSQTNVYAASLKFRSIDLEPTSVIRGRP